MLNTFHLRTFLAVVDSGNYTAAAEQLHMSQPAVSQHIRALEEQLSGVRLFRRVGQRMVPTHAGEELLLMARELVALAERAEQSILALKGQVTGRVTIGCTPSSGEYLLPPLLAAFRKQFPAVNLVVEVASSEFLLQALAAQQLVMILIEEQHRRRGWEAQLLGSESLTLLAPPDTVLPEQGETSPNILHEKPLVLPRTGSPLRRTIEESLRRRGVTISDLQIALEVDSIAMALRGVHDGLGMAFVPNTRLPHDCDLVSIELAGISIQQEWYALRPRERSAPRAVQELYTFLTGPAARTKLAELGLHINH
ncbi:MAG: LysR family transcriptional regulator [Chloroflexales bacterium]|nr:LysR family transcriptional regulator [Chloroflexales bacterium]